MATHQALAALPDDPDLRGLRTAAGAAANPGVRRLATVGGNLCAADFAAGDLVPALLALGAEVTVAAPAGESGMDLPAFLSWREAPGPWLLTGIRAAREPARRSAHARLPMRKAGDYPCAILSLSLVPTGGRIRAPRIAIGAVEGTARRWTALETLLEGARLDPAGAEAAARKLTGELSPREGPDAPGWYRLSVLPVLVRRALEDLGGREWS
jgi:carbon-monoxide dehydrogenase medium subunit